MLKVLLVVDFPIDLDSSDARILKLELLGNWCRVGNDARHRKGGWDRFVVQANLINRYNNWAPRDANADREFESTKTLNV